MVNEIIFQAIVNKASDIYIEPSSKGLEVKYTINGIIKEVMIIPNHLSKSVISRIKIMSGIEQTKKTQTGIIKINLEDKKFDLMVSIVPTNNKEKVVILIKEV